MDQAREKETELEAFRQRWRQEVKAKQTTPLSSNNSIVAKRQNREQQRKIVALSGAPGPSTARRKEANDDEVAPHVYHDLPDNEDHLKLGSRETEYVRSKYRARKPKTALEHYERAVEKEAQGSLGDSVSLYRQAFKLDDGVHEAYKKKHFPPSSFKPNPTNTNPTNAAVTVPGTAHHSLHGSKPAVSPSLAQLIEGYSGLSIERAPPIIEGDRQGPCYLAGMPQEILTEILQQTALVDLAAFTRLSQVCKRLAYLVVTEEAIWKRITLGSEFGLCAMHYDYACDLEGFPLEANDEIARYLGSGEPADETELTPPVDHTQILLDSSEALLHSTYASSWRQMFRSRPRIRFNGCYISTVNYTRPGAPSTNSLTWGSPVHVVTYFRYLHFFRDGTVISLLTTTEPIEVVHHLTKANLGNPAAYHSILPSAVMKDALRGRWRMSGHELLETEGDVQVETEGAVPKYMYRMVLSMAHAGKGSRNNKLSWKRFWSYNRLTDDWGEFGLKNDKAYYFSRVRSYGMGW